MRLDLLVQAEQTAVSLGALYRGVFLDRDGTINEEVGYLSRLDQFRFIDGAAEAVKLLNESGLKAVIVTNQAGVARGYLSEKALQQIHCVMAEALRAQYARLDAIYYCPHHPIEGVGAYKNVLEASRWILKQTVAGNHAGQIWHDFGEV